MLYPPRNSSSRVQRLIHRKQAPSSATFSIIHPISSRRNILFVDARSRFAHKISLSIICIYTPFTFVIVQITYASQEYTETVTSRRQWEYTLEQLFRASKNNNNCGASKPFKVFHPNYARTENNRRFSVRNSHNSCANDSRPEFLKKLNVYSKKNCFVFGLKLHWNCFTIIVV